MRIDIMEALKELNPSFLRFPGGNNLEGNTNGSEWKWQETIGDLTQRPGREGTWGYYNTDGLGLVEYMFVRLNFRSGLAKSISKLYLVVPRSRNGAAACISFRPLS